MRGRFADVVRRTMSRSSVEVPNRRAVIHIGRFKTGSSALQKWLASNADFLNRHGFIFPESGRLQHWPFAHHAVQSEFFRTGKLPVDLIEEVQSSNQNILLSCENFGETGLYHPEFPCELAKLFDGFRVEILLFVRRPSPWIESFYREKVMRGELDRQIQNFSDFLAREAIHISDKKLIDPWRQSFPSATFRFVSYETALKTGGVVSGFLEAVGISHAEVSVQTPTENASLPEPYLHLLREIRPELKDDTETYNHIVEAVWKLKTRLDRGSEPLVAKSQKDIEILRECEENHLRFLIENRITVAD